MLKLEKITTKIANKTIIEDITLEVKAGEVVAIMGPSGSGKTTLLQTILGVLQPTLGTVFVSDINVTNVPIEDRHIGYLPQSYGLFPHLSVLENVGYGLRIRGMNHEQYRKESSKMLELVGLAGFENRKINELSGGQRQRVGLARALATKPKLLLLDEPLSNIDTITKAEVAIELEKIFEELKIPIVFVTHSIEEAEYFADRIAILIDGKVIQIGKPDELRKRPKNEIVTKLLFPFATNTPKPD